MSVHHHHRHQRRGSRLGSLLRAYAFEIVAVLIVALGIFLLVERTNIRGLLFRWATLQTRAALHAMGHVDEALVSFVSRVTLSDAIGLALIGLAAVVIVLRIRWRLVRTESLTTLRCPRCSGSLHRVHRHLGDRLVNGFVPVRRYRCANKECGWGGLRIATNKHGAEPATPAQ